MRVNVSNNWPWEYTQRILLSSCVCPVLTSRISLLAFGEVFSRNTLMATGIFTFSPSGAHTPWNDWEESFTENVRLNVLVLPLKNGLPHLVNGTERPSTQHFQLLQLRLFQDAHLSLIGWRPAGGQRFHQLFEGEHDATVRHVQVVLGISSQQNLACTHLVFLQYPSHCLLPLQLLLPPQVKEK